MVISTYPMSPQLLPDVPSKIVDITLARVWNHQADSGKDLGDGAPPARGAGLLTRVRNAPTSRTLALSIKELLVQGLLPSHVRQIRAIMADFRPQLVHALRIPFEGIVAARALGKQNTPLAVSIWGNDLTWQAAERPAIARGTRIVLDRADGLITDCDRDLRLAREWGFPEGRPSAVVPTSGGIDRSIFFPGPASPALTQQLRLSEGSPVIVNPRGFRQYVCQEAFFRALPAVIERFPALIVLAVGFRDFPSFGRMVDELGIAAHVRLLPLLSHRMVGDVFRLSSVSVSPSIHDGTPNSLLEAMATGCVPVAGDIESIREWIRDGYNGVLCDPRDPASQAEAMIRALSDHALQERAREHNLGLVQARAEQGAVMTTVNALYQELAGSRHP